MLTALGAAPDPVQERKLFIGKTIAFIYRIGAWWVPKYGTGRL
jgi:hypothetical protein